MTVYVITGPPAAGKTTWIRERAKPGDITIDYDDLVQALSPGLPSDPVEQPPHVVATVLAARTAVINDASMDSDSWGTGSRYDVYIVHAMPDRHAMNRYHKYGFEIVTIDPGYDECMRRALEGGRTPRQQALITDWYERRGLSA